MIDAPDLRRRVDAELIRTQYHQLQRSSVLIVLFVVAIVSEGTSDYWVFGWAAAYAVFLALQELMVRCYRRAAPDDAAVISWGRLAAAMLAVSGLLWGIGFYHFIDPQQPLKIGLLIAAMAAITVGSVALRSTILPGFYAFVLLVCGFMAVRFFREDGELFKLLGLSMFLYVPVIVKYGGLQHRVIADSISTRLSNEALVSALRDETLAAEAARRDAERANLAKSQFLAAASHDLRQPLYALSLFSASLGALRLDSDARAIVGDIQNSITAMETLFVGLLDISKLDAGVVEPKFESVSVDAVFDRLSQYFRPIAISRGLELRLRSDGEWIRSDAVLLEQVLGNLVANALRWTSTGGVLIAARRCGTHVRLEVWDTGIGISPADQQRIFDDFVQLDNDERDRRKGLGLGLAIARRASRLIDSDIDLASRVGMGSRFRITQGVVPPPSVVEEQSGPQRGIAPISARDASLPILVVEDDPIVGAALRQLLVSWGLPVVVLTDVSTVLKTIDDGARFGLLLTDYRLRGRDTGLALARAVAERHPHPAPPTILITGDVGDELIAAAHADGVALLHKPVSAHDLMQLLGIR